MEKIEIWPLIVMRWHVFSRQEGNEIFILTTIGAKDKINAKSTTTRTLI
jgi:hypothetical protein